MVVALVVAAVAAGLLLLLSPPGARLRKRGMARYYDAAQRRYETAVADRKRTLLADLAGTVLELGPGTGANFAHFPDGVRRWVGIEPNPYMHPALRDAAAARGVEAEFREVGAEGMDVDEGSVDVVLCTLVLCSVPDPARVVADVRRVLAPGGRFVFVEHVAAPPGSWLRLAQRLLKPLWCLLADGCRPDRDLAAVLRDAGFDELHLDAFVVPRGVVPAVVSRQIAGWAR